jgi:hypothetical protein
MIFHETLTGINLFRYFCQKTAFTKKLKIVATYEDQKQQAFWFWVSQGSA